MLVKELYDKNINYSESTLFNIFIDDKQFTINGTCLRRDYGKYLVSLFDDTDIYLECPQ